MSRQQEEWGNELDRVLGGIPETILALRLGLADVRREAREEHGNDGWLSRNLFITRRTFGVLVPIAFDGLVRLVVSPGFLGVVLLAAAVVSVVAATGVDVSAIDPLAAITGLGLGVAIVLALPVFGAAAHGADDPSPALVILCLVCGVEAVLYHVCCRGEVGGFFAFLSGLGIGAFLLQWVAPAVHGTPGEPEPREREHGFFHLLPPWSIADLLARIIFAATVLWVVVEVWRADVRGLIWDTEPVGGFSELVWFVLPFVACLLAAAAYGLLLALAVLLGRCIVQLVHGRSRDRCSLWLNKWVDRSSESLDTWSRPVWVARDPEFVGSAGDDYRETRHRVLVDQECSRCSAHREVVRTTTTSQLLDDEYELDSICAPESYVRHGAVDS